MQTTSHQNIPSDIVISGRDELYRDLESKTGYFFSLLGEREKVTYSPRFCRLHGHPREGYSVMVCRSERGSENGKLVGILKGEIAEDMTLYISGFLRHENEGRFWRDMLRLMEILVGYRFRGIKRKVNPRAIQATS